MRIHTCLTFVAAVLLFIGCGPARPTDMPTTAPCTITVLDGGKPMRGVSVVLFYAEGSASLVIGGMTNASGVAEIKTTWGNYTAKGAPIGVSKVTVDKSFEIPPETVTPEESARWTPAQGAKYERERMEMVDKLRIIPAAISDISLTPLSVSVESRTGGSLTIEVGDHRR